LNRLSWEAGRSRSRPRWRCRSAPNVDPTLKSRGLCGRRAK
jgi:hypothetical protein